MFTVLIVEDEMLVRIGLKNSIDWAKLDLKVIGDVSDGQSAFEFYQKEKPNIILTDIKMPVMDGIQLISKIRENDTETRIVILTCYEEFDLIHRALKLGISDYILKLKMSAEEMGSVLKKVKKEIEKESIATHINQEVKTDTSLLKEDAIKKYIFYQNYYSDPEFAEIIAKLNLRMDPGRSVMCVMMVDRYYLLQDKFEDKHGDLIRFSLLNIIDELLEGYQRGEIIHEKEERYILIFSFNDITSENKTFELLQDILARINSVIKTYINVTVTFGISRIYSSYASLKPMYQECMLSLEQKYFHGNGGYLRYNGDTANKDEILSLIEMKTQRLLAEFDPPDIKFRKEIESRIGTLSTSIVSKNEINKIFIGLIHYFIVNSNVNRDEITKLALEYGGRISQCATLDDVIDLFRQYVKIVLGLTAVKHLSKEVAEAVQFIEKNYNKDMSLQQIAEQVEMSPNYLGSLFKKELHLNFVEYVNQVRIDKAKDLLLKTHMKSYEVSEKVGFSDDSYFSRIFKNHTGVRPNEFRKHWFADIQEESDVNTDKSKGVNQ